MQFGRSTVGTVHPQSAPLIVEIGCPFSPCLYADAEAPFQRDDDGSFLEVRLWGRWIPKWAFRVVARPDTRPVWVLGLVFTYAAVEKSKNRI